MKQYSKEGRSEVAERIKATVSIPVVWEKVYGCIPAKWSSCRCPWREDKTASFSVSPDGQVWFDHGTGDKGEVFNFYQRAIGCDSRRAFLNLFAMAGGGPVSPVTAATGPADPKKQYHPRLRVPSMDS